MVVQCPTCQSKFRIADDKVTDRGVRVRCTSCKNVFQVRKPGASSSEPAPGPGNTMDLSSLNAATVARPGARPGVRAATRPPPAASPPRPGASRPPAAARGNGAARRLQADDLFGMAELTGDAPLGDLAPSKAPFAAPPPARPAAKPMPNFDDIDLDVDDAPPPPPSRPPPPKASRPPPPPKAAAEPPPGPAQEPPPPPAFDDPGSLPAVTNGVGRPGAPTDTGGPDPFEGMSFGEPGPGAIDLAAQPKKDKPAEVLQAGQQAASPAAPPPAPELPPGRELVSSALTGLVGAALAIAVVVVAAISGDASAGWLGLGHSNEIVATRVVSGLYDTAAGKPVFFVRGRVENRGQRVRGPVRVTAELVSDGNPEARAEAIAGAEPTPEEVWSLRTAADVDKLNRTLEVTKVERKLQPGSSLPFFTVIADPPADLQRHRLHVKVESVDAWVPPAPKGKAGK